MPTHQHRSDAVVALALEQTLFVHNHQRLVVNADGLDVATYLRLQLFFGFMVILRVSWWDP